MSDTVGNDAPVAKAATNVDTDAKKMTKKQLKAMQYREKLARLSKPSEHTATNGAGETNETDGAPTKNRKERRAAKFGHTLEPKKTEEANDREPKRKAKKEEVVEEVKQKFEKRTNGAGSAVRFIAFIGNIPFKTTAQDIKSFMRAANPISVRLMTDKNTGKSRGFAFAEFGNSSDYKNALKFHHGRMGEKKINVELTAGGGGNSADRVQKIQTRREELEKERKRSSDLKRQRTAEDDDSKSKSKDNDGGDDGDEADSSAATDRPQRSAAPHVHSAKRIRSDRPAKSDKSNSADVQSIADYDDGSSKDKNDKNDKKPNRRKRGRGSH
ncbi:hypothetical protein LPJ66_004545 [Kickxella alabastrina]|uniref:Uncharacterized protein n=1 Tax=Kickxella alabastrina TaxID=61397 RepID=A0ACC1IL25_9FUNG|nr:hypothetical protein LPJ66_004545 [Kickxella alabastrina]